MKLQSIYKIVCLMLFFLVFLTCKKEERQIIPEGKLLFSFHKPIFWRVYDSVALQFSTEESFCSATTPFNYDISNNKINMDLGVFTSTDCEIMHKFSRDILFKNLENTVYKIKIKRPHREDSASIYITDSMFVMKSESEDIEFEKDTVRRILPHTIWVSHFYCNSTDSMRIIEIDSAMHAVGATPKILPAGDYFYFYVNRDHTLRKEYTPPCNSIIRTYDFNGDRTKLVDFYNALKKKYNYKVSLDIYAWDKVITW